MYKKYSSVDLMIVILKFGRLEHQVLLYKTVYRVFLYGKKKNRHSRNFYSFGNFYIYKAIKSDCKTLHIKKYVMKMGMGYHVKEFMVSFYSDKQHSILIIEKY
jgi:hypothetical protein